MIIVIALIALITIMVVLFISTFFTIETYEEKWIYDENGKNEKCGYEIDNYEDLKLEKYNTYKCRRVGKKRLVKEDWWEFGDNGSGWFLGFGLIFLVALLATGIPCICVHGPIHQEERALSINCEIEKLQSRERTLHLTLAGDLGLQVTDSPSTYHVVVDKPIELKTVIDEYNSDVIDLKKTLYMEKVYSESPWINWFINPGFKKVEGYNGSATTYKAILGDNLKTFELNEN